ncbi:hypothetical protein EDD21DRAFT_361721 [Dissophora ornata]|nr:hypothetical protein BGZ58_008418 [Dissophora ornata]KAI8606189.1 hypothetical protein EDD21DRAFT_361721 [Dissophora ornata]
MEKALTLPEILERIGNYLNHTDIISCIRVCKAWKAEFEPRLWRSFKLNFFVPESELPHLPAQQNGKHIGFSVAQRAPSQTLMQQNGKHIRELTLNGMNLEYWSTSIPHCSNLDEVTFMVPWPLRLEGKGLVMTDFGKMIKNHPRLRKIVLESSGGSIYPTHEFLEDLTTCPRLIVLETNDCIFDGPLTEQYMRACASNIRRLSSRGDVFSRDFTISSDLVFEELRYFDLRDIEGMSEDTKLSWISRCPNLISLRWETGSEIPAAKFSQIIPSACPNLTALHLVSPILDEDIARILEVIPRIEKLSLTNTHAGRGAFEALRRHFPTLKDINLQFCMYVESPMIQEILSSCPKLQSISAEILEYEDMPEQQPWVCRNLQMFDVGIQIAPLSFSRQRDLSEIARWDAKHRLVYGRLAQLAGLQYLSICNNSQRPNSAQRSKWLQLSLNAGLGQLETLKQLKFFSCKHFMATAFDKGEADGVVRWILEHWRKLESLEGMTGKEASKATAVLEMMKARDVEFIDYMDYHDEADESYIFSERELDDDDDDFSDEELGHMGSEDSDDSFVW